MAAGTVEIGAKRVLIEALAPEFGAHELEVRI